MAAASTLKRVEQDLQPGQAEAQRLGSQAAMVVVDAAGRLMGALRFAHALWATPQIPQANKHP